MKSMNRRRFLEFTGAFAFASAFPAKVDAQTSRPPNFVFVLADDLGWSQLGCYGSSYYESPNIDRLATQGMTFTDAYAACPVCSPTRASIMTGKYPARLHLTDFIDGGNPPKNSPLAHPDWRKHLPLEEITIAEALKQEGYRTAFFGKWHLSEEKMPPRSLPLNPDKQGFDEHFVTYKPSGSMKQEWQTPENDGHNVELITRKSLKFMEDHRDSPFFLYVSHNTIHEPLMEREATIEKYRNKPGAELHENNPIIGAMIERLDQSVGTLMAELDELDLADNTVFIFYSDNGGLESDADQMPLRSGKANLYEGGIRVPLIVRRPGHVQPGTLNHSLVSSIDMFPTLLEMAGSDNKYDDIDGISIMPTLTKKSTLKRDAVYWHYPHFHSAGSGPSGAVRMGRFKLIEWYEPTLMGREKQVELFDLEEDLSETRDLAEEMPEKTKELRNMLITWRKSVGAQMPTVIRE
jgi:arylsulfatase A